MNKLLAVIVAIFVLVMPMMQVQPPVVNADAPTQSNVAASSVSVVSAPSGAVAVGSLSISNGDACAVTPTPSAAVVQQTIHIDELLTCKTFAFARVVEVPSLSVVSGQAPSVLLTVKSSVVATPTLRVSIQWQPLPSTLFLAAQSEKALLILGMYVAIYSDEYDFSAVYSTFASAHRTLAELGSRLC